MKPIKLLFALMLSVVLWSACQEKKNENTVVPQESLKAKLPAPFRFHKAIEVKPGLTFDVFSWGRGVDSLGAYLILRSDSTHLKYRSVGGDLDGKIVDVWNMDMDSDGNPELFIQAKTPNSHLKMYVYEFSDNGSSQELRFPDLSASSRKTYRGQDSVYIKDGRLLREFPLFEEADSVKKPTGQKKILEYKLRNNTFGVEEVKQ